MFVVDKEAKIRSLFVMPSAKTFGEREEALHKMVHYTVFKNLHISIYPIGAQACF